MLAPQPWMPKDALEKYLQLAPDASDRTAVAEKLRDLSRGPMPPLSSPRPSAPSTGRDNRPACDLGMYWSSAKEQCVKIGE